MASKTYGMAEVLEGGVEGFLAPVGYAAAVVEAIVTAVKGSRRLTAVGAVGFVLCERQLAPALVAEETVDFYRSVGRG